MKSKKKKLGIDFFEYDVIPVTMVDLEFSNKTSLHNDYDDVAWEKFFHELPTDQLEYFVCRYMGFKPKEINIILELPDESRQGNIRVKLRRAFRDSNWLNKQKP
jgi:hypothetical protein